MSFKWSNNENKYLLNPIKKTVMDYHLIEDGDRIAVGLSGGKDSIALYVLLKGLQNKLPVSFDIVPVSLTLGFDGLDLTPLQQFLETAFDDELAIKETNISDVVFNIRQEKNPCALCANMRRGHLYEYAKTLGCNKTALGHHLDDALETYFMNFLYNGKMGTFQPKSYLDRTDMTIIRPLISLEEARLIKFVHHRKLPVIENPCPVDKKTKREEMKQLISQLSESYPDVRQKFFRAARTIDENDFWHIDGS